MATEKTTIGPDLSTLNLTVAANGGTKIELTHPVTKAPLGVFISVLGKDSDVFKDAVKEKLNARLRRDALAARRGKDPEVPTVEKMEADALELLVACTLGWDNMNLGGPLEFSIPNVIKLYTELPWVRTQVDEAIGDVELFLKT